MEGWTSQRVLALAPDPASGRAGQGLASAGKWASAGRDADALWGECRGSGANPYQVRVALDGPAFKCSCPSRKFPCKHAIGLMLLAAAGDVAPAGPPPWAAEWMAARAGRKQAADAPKPVDAAAQAKRRQQRLDRVADGLASLRLWVHDLVRGGVATAAGRGYAFFDEPARRMVDAQAPGVAAMVQRLAVLATGGVAGWERPFVEGLASIHLLVAAHDRLDALPEPTRDDVLATLGLATPADDVLARPGVHDRWQVVAREVTAEDRLRVARTWLFGTATRRPVLVLTFAFGTAPLDLSLAPGSAFDGEVCRFPGTGVRGLVKARNPAAPLTALDGLDTIDALCDLASGLTAAHPWLGEVAVPVRGLTLVTAESGLSLVDRDRRSLPAVLPLSGRWTLLALAGGGPADLTVAYDGRRLRPLAVVHDGAFTPLTAAEVE